MGLVIALVAALVIALGIIAVQRSSLAKARLELEAAKHQLQAPPPPRSLVAAGRLVRNVVESASHVRQHGVADFLMSSIQDFTQWTAEEEADIATAARPDGTVTIVFSDIENSTETNERLGDAGWLRLLAEHDRIVRSHVERRSGHVVKTQGDGFMIAFGEPLDAVDAALAIQDAFARGGGRHLRRNPVSVRIGMHLGEVKSRGGDYFGRNVAVAARVAAHAGGGEILVTDEVRAALDDTDQAVLVDAGEVELKGLTGLHQLWSVQPG